MSKSVPAAAKAAALAEWKRGAKALSSGGWRVFHYWFAQRGRFIPSFCLHFKDGDTGDCGECPLKTGDICALPWDNIESWYNRHLPEMDSYGRWGTTWWDHVEENTHEEESVRLWVAEMIRIISTLPSIWEDEFVPFQCQVTVTWQMGE